MPYCRLPPICHEANIRDAELFDDNAKPEVISRKRVLPRDVALLMVQPGSASACSCLPS